MRPPDAHAKLIRENLMEDAKWLMGFGEHPLQIAASVKRNPRAIYDAARREGDQEVLRYFANYSTGRSHDSTL